MKWPLLEPAAAFTTILTGEPSDIVYYVKRVNPDCDFERDIERVSLNEEGFDVDDEDEYDL